MSFDSCTPVELITDGTPITYGVVQPGPEDADGVLFIRGGDISGGRINTANLRTISRELSHQYKRTLLKGGELVISLVGNPGEVAIVPNALKGANIARQVGLVRVDKNRFHPKFVQYYLMSPAGKAQLFSYSLGSVQSVINLKELKRVEIPNFPLETQEKIVKCLGEIDEKIDLNRRINQTLEAMAQAIFKSWFVDFDPVKAKIAAIAQGQDPLRAAMRAISGKTDAELDQMPREHHDQLAATAALFPDEMEDVAQGSANAASAGGVSALGGIPRGWRIATVSEFAVLIGGKQLEKEHITSDGYFPVFGGAGVMGYTENYNADGFVISVGRVGAYCGQFFSHRGKAWINNNASLIQQKDEKLGEWLFISLRHAEIDTIKKGAAQPFVSNGDIAKLPLLWPGEEVTSAFTKHISLIFRYKEANDQQSQTLIKIRDTLLPKLLSGELSVENIPVEVAH